MQRHEVQLRGAESWGGGGWGRTASAPPAGAFETSGGVVPSRCPGSHASGAGDHGGRPYEFVVEFKRLQTFLPARASQRIRHSGERFSANARAPSTASSDDQTDSISIAPIRRA